MSDDDLTLSEYALKRSHYVDYLAATLAEIKRRIAKLQILAVMIRELLADGTLKSPTSADAVDPSVASTGTPSTRV